MRTGKLTGEFVFDCVETEPVASVLYQRHLALAGKARMAEFAGYLMPLWYSSISSEHNAVRTAAGLFDCTHMGVLEVSGGDAEAFLNLVTTNRIDNLSVGRARYSYILDAAGNVLDDIIVYRRSEDKFMVVVNAANEPKIKAYIKAVVAGEVVIDVENPDRRCGYKPHIRDMRDTGGDDCRVDIALQGPRATEVLVELVDNEQDRQMVKALPAFSFIEAAVAGFDCIISRTGYTGSEVGFELFVHPDEVVGLWDRLLENGKSFGLAACGLGARDSLRIEAGLPLYGHELAGEFGISAFEAGYGWAVKQEKDFFVGKKAVQQRAKTYTMTVVRIELPGEGGIRPVRYKDGVLDEKGDCIGWVLSCAKIADKQIALVFINKEAAKEGVAVGVYYLARNDRQIQQGKKLQVERNENLKADIVGAIESRFAKF